jgi:hypothetical protein
MTAGKPFAFSDCYIKLYWREQNSFDGLRYLFAECCEVYSTALSKELWAVSVSSHSSIAWTFLFQRPGMRNHIWGTCTYKFRLEDPPKYLLTFNGLHGVISRKTQHLILFVGLFFLENRLCGLLVRVPGYRSRDPSSIPNATRFSEK